MNINLIRTKPFLRRLDRMCSALERIADCYELELAQQQLYTREPVVAVDEKNSTLSYVDEEMDAAQELLDIERARRREPVEEA